MAFGSKRRSAQNSDYDNTNRGILFENDRKRSDKHPDFRGSINVDGRDYWLSGWEKETKKGPALSLSVEPKQDNRREDYERNGRRDDSRSYREASRGGDYRDDAPPPSPDDYGADYR